MTYLLRIIFLAFNIYFSKSKTSFSGGTVVEIVREIRKEKKRILQQKFPPRKKFRKERIDRRFKSTKPKDHRFSNQRTLRRMYRNS